MAPDQEGHVPRLATSDESVEIAKGEEADKGPGVRGRPGRPATSVDRDARHAAFIDPFDLLGPQTRRRVRG